MPPETASYIPRNVALRYGGGKKIPLTWWIYGKFRWLIMILCIHFTITATVIYNNCSNLDEFFGWKREKLEKIKLPRRSYYFFIESWNPLTVFPFLRTLQLCGREKKGEHRSIISSKLYIFISWLRLDLSTRFFDVIFFVEWNMIVRNMDDPNKNSCKILHPIFIVNDHTVDSTVNYRSHKRNVTKNY